MEDPDLVYAYEDSDTLQVEMAGEKSVITRDCSGFVVVLLLFVIFGLSIDWLIDWLINVWIVFD